MTKHNEHHRHEHNTRLLLPPTVSSKYHPVDASSVLTMNTGARTATSAFQPSSDSCNPLTFCGDCLKKLFYRIFRVIIISDMDIESKRGPDAVQYLMFQRYLIYYLILLTTVCTLIILPMNMKGTMNDANSRYALTTITNIDMRENADSLWVHSILSVLMLPLAVILMSFFNSKVQSKSDSVAKRTLLIRHIPVDKVNKDPILQFMHQKFPDAVVEGIQLVYDIKYLKRLHSNLINAQNAISCVWSHVEEYKCRYEMRPYCCGHMGGICCFCTCCCSKSRWHALLSRRGIPVAAKAGHGVQADDECADWIRVHNVRVRAVSSGCGAVLQSKDHEDDQLHPLPPPDQEAG